MAKSSSPTLPTAEADQTAPLEGRKPGDSLVGDRIYIECRKPADWVKFRMSGQHNGHCTTAMKNAKAILEVAYKNAHR